MEIIYALRASGLTDREIAPFARVGYAYLRQVIKTQNFNSRLIVKLRYACRCRITQLRHEQFRSNGHQAWVEGCIAYLKEFC